VFGWQTQVTAGTPEFRYTVLQHGEEQLAGIMDASAFLPEGAPAQWPVYFGAEDADATLADTAPPGRVTCRGTARPAVGLRHRKPVGRALACRVYTGRYE
jgi:predicted enzyme related to lactoylglutathione lyase